MKLDVLYAGGDMGPRLFCVQPRENELEKPFLSPRESPGYRPVTKKLYKPVLKCYKVNGGA